MENLSMRMEGTKLVVEIDLAVETGMSKSGKSLTIATTGGNHLLSELISYDGDAIVGINVYRKAPTVAERLAARTSS